MIGDNGNATPISRRLVVRCAIYTRKSTDENLDSDFNSLDAQREAAENYIRSQQAEGWVALPDRYDDGAYSGASLERPALKRLLSDIEAGKVDVVVIYKIDRLSRSLLDFTKLIELLDQHEVTMVSVTQQFNTTTSMGRLTLNILLSFAQFEREVIAERIRDKVAGAKRRGKWMGGTPQLGYDVDRPNKRLMVNADEAAQVRYIFRRFLQLRSAVALIKELNEQGKLTKSWTTVRGRFRPGRPWNKSVIYKMLRNPLYIGMVRHKEDLYPGEHEAIIDKSLWEEVQRTLSGNRHYRANDTRSRTPAMLKGILRCGHCDKPMGITFTKKGDRRYRYYLCQKANKTGYDTCPVRTVPAGDVEQAVMIQLRRIFQSPEILAETLRVVQHREQKERDQLVEENGKIEAEIATLRTNASRLVESDMGKNGSFVSEELVRMEQQLDRLTRDLATNQAEIQLIDEYPTRQEDLFEQLETLDNIWNELFPKEKQRLIQLLVERAVVTCDGIDLVLRIDGIRSIAAELNAKEAVHAE